MKKCCQFFIAAILILSDIFANANTEKHKLPEKERAQYTQELPINDILFTQNKGQMTDMSGRPVPFVLFKAEAPGVTMYITKKGITYLFLKAEEERNEKAGTGEKEKERELNHFKKDKKVAFYWERVDMELKGSGIKREDVIKEGVGVTDLNFFYPHCPSGIYNVKSHEKITIKDVYPGIDWVFYNSNDKGFKYDFVVNPQADYKLIELLYQSRIPVKINLKGEIELRTGYGNITENKPVSFSNGEEISTQFIQNYQRPIQINGDNGYETSVSFNFTTRFPLGGEVGGLIIDPQLIWATFYGGNGVDGPMSVDTDGNGNVLVTGYTASTNFPVQNAGTFFQGTNAGGLDIFILKFDNAGNRLWAAYYGGSSSDWSNSIATDGSGNIFVTGYTTSTNFPVQNAGTFFQGTNAGSLDAFILKFDNVGNRLWATYYGGTGFDQGNSIVTNASGDVLVTGETGSSNFPVQNAGTFFQGIYAGSFDAIILKFDNAGNRLWATYYGGSSDDYGHSIATDGSGNVFVAGQTGSASFPLQNAGTFFQGTYGGAGSDAFILKFDNAGNRLWATYYGGSGNDDSNSIATDGSGNVFVTGETSSSNFSVQNTGTFFQGTYAGSGDAFILKFDNAGNRLWATYYGGSGGESDGSIGNLAIDTCNNLYMSFVTASTDMPLQAFCDAGYQDNTHNGGTNDIALVLFDNMGNRLWATYLGGDGMDFREALAVDRNNNLFMVGEWVGVTNNATCPLANPGGSTYFDSTFNGSDDGYIVKFAPTPIVANVTSTIPSCSNTCNGSATVNVSGICAYTYLWSNAQTTQTAIGLCGGTYTITVTNQLCIDTTLTVNIIAPTGSFTFLTSISQPTCGNSNGSITVTPNPAGTYTYSWSPSAQTTAIAIGLIAGTTYTVTVMDSKGCIATATTAIISPPPLVGQFTKGTANCTGCGCKEWIMVNAIGGTSPYTYAWPDGYLNRYKNQLCPGTYMVNVKDKNGCSVTINIAAP